MKPVVRVAERQRAWRLLLLTACLILGVPGLGAADGQAATPTSLNGETFTSQHVLGSKLSGTCDLEGGSFTFSVSGSAAGPFPGTFAESGSFTAFPDGFLNSFSSTFTITNSSGAVTVTGSKSLVPDDFSQMSCNHNSVTAPRNFTTSYTATIAGTGVDKGRASVNIAGDINFKSATPVFIETFGSGVGEPSPTSKDQCKHGGWKNFPQFKNQGQCVSFVASGGKKHRHGRR